MEPSQASKTNDLDNQDIVISQLPKTKGWFKSGYSKFQGFWFPTLAVSNVINFQRDFKARDQDIILASKPKSGTTWLKALLFSIVNRTRYTPSNTPLLTSNPHKLVPFFEYVVYADGKIPDLTELVNPRHFATHIPNSSLPKSIVDTSKSKIVYIARNPFDVVVSYFHFTLHDHPDGNADLTMEDIVDAFCEGRDGMGPYWDQVLGFWKASLERPEKVLFLKYEDMKLETESQVKKIAEFIGFPFSEDEEKRGVVGEICELCSLESLKGLGMKNKHEAVVEGFDNTFFYRKGEVGSWVDDLTPSVVDRIQKVIQEKFGGSNLTFKYSV